MVILPGNAISRGYEPTSPQGRRTMANAIAWETEMGKALSRAKSEGKEVFLDFFNPG
jgi:hypothetical protein